MRTPCLRAKHKEKPAGNRIVPTVLITQPLQGRNNDACRRQFFNRGEHINYWLGIHARNGRAANMLNPTDDRAKGQSQPVSFLKKQLSPARLVGNHLNRVSGKSDHEPKKYITDSKLTSNGRKCETN